MRIAVRLIAVWSVLAGLIHTSSLIAAEQSIERFIVMASTTSTVNSGLFDYLLPKFSNKFKMQIRVVGVGTGQALRIARRGDADVLFVHHKESELAFVRNGFGVKRLSVMYNDFIIVGPQVDPAKIKKTKTAAAAYQAIAQSRAVFVSRGDDSGTHKKSLAIWQSAINTKPKSAIWYQESGAGMGATLNIASSMEAYTLTDRATWENFNNKTTLKILFENDPLLQNQYGIIKVNPALHKHVKSQEAEIFIKWVLSAEGQATINTYRLNGKQVFFANAPGKKMN